jgi:hypothetical protein
MGKRARIWLIAALLMILVGFFSIVGLLTGRARSVSRIVMDRWAETLGSPEEVFERFPRTEMNDPARRIVEAASILGIDIAPRADEDLPRPTHALILRFRRFKGASAGWSKRQLGRGDNNRDETPPDAREFLLEFREPIDRIEQILVAEERLSWNRDVMQLWDAPMPNLLGHVDLTKLLIDDSLFRLDQKDIDGAERALEAAWRLNEALDDDPNLMTQMIRLNGLRMQAAALRQLPWLDRWIPRLDGRRYREAFDRAMLHEGWVWPQMDFRPKPGQDLAAKVQSFVFGPYMELATADASERWRRKILRLTELETLCRAEIDSAGVRLDIPMPWWNRFGALLPANLEGALESLVITQQQLELTRKLLEIGAMRLETGRWPDLDDAWLESSFCPGDRWIYSRDGEGISLKLSRDPDDSSERNGPAAWTFSLGP